MTTQFTQFSFPATGASSSRTMPDRLADIINVRDYGATGDGSTDDYAAIKLALEAAFGTVASPHGNAGKFTNRPVWFPRGNYQSSGYFHLPKVQGGHIFGDGAGSTRISYTGAYSGNTVAQGQLSGPDIATVNAITPIFITDGWAYSRFEGINLSHAAKTNSAGFYLFWNGLGNGGPTQNRFSDLLIDGASTGYLIGYLTPGLCSETLFEDCDASSCSYGFRNIAGNALNNALIRCGAVFCTTCGISCLGGNIDVLGGSFAHNALDIELSTWAMSIVGCRTESANFIDVGTGGQGWAHVSACKMAQAGGAGFFARAENGSKIIMDACQSVSAVADEGVIAGANSTVYLRGNDFRNTHNLDNFTGTVAQNI